MKRLLLSFFFLLTLVGLASAQTNVTPLPDCITTFNVTSALPSPAFDNRTQGCTSWMMSYSNTGFTTVNIQVERAADSAGLPGSFTVWTAANVTTTPAGGFPMTDTTGGFAVMTADKAWPWVRANITTASGGSSQAVKGVLYGYRNPSVANSVIAQTVKSTPWFSGFTTDYDSTVTSLPNVLTALTATTTVVLGGYCNNTDTAVHQVTLTDTAGNQYLSSFSIPANSNLFLNWGPKGLKLVGIKWNADAASKVNCQITGLQ